MLNSFYFARVAELVDAPVLEIGLFNIIGGSSPLSSINSHVKTSLVYRLWHYVFSVGRRVRLSQEVNTN